MLEYLKKFNLFISGSLILLMVLVVVLSVAELYWIIAKDIFSRPLFVLEIHELLEIFGFFLLILIGLELIDTMKAYLTTGVIHAEVILSVAIIALARKIVILDTGAHDGVTLIGIGVIIIALAVTHYLIKRTA
ncbi:MAG: phosphate-starvation-inducible PsiE family protein [Pseudomonadota bacterium]